MRYLLFLLSMQVAVTVAAQNKVSYTGTLDGGLLAGSKRLDAYAFTTHGIQLGQYAVALGSGVDNYPFSSVPLFLEVRKGFGDTKLHPFVQAAAGANFTNKNSAVARASYSGITGDFSTGFFARGGGGLLFNTQKKVQLALSAGFSYKSSVYNYAPFTGTPWDGQMVPVKDVYHFNRWYLGVGVWW